MNAFRALACEKPGAVYQAITGIKELLSRSGIIKEPAMVNDKDDVDLEKVDGLLSEIVCTCTGGVMHNSRQALLSVKCLALEARQIINNDEDGGDAA